jgi:predicted peptidase
MRSFRLDQRLDQLPVRMEQEELQVGDRLVTYGALVPKTPPPSAGYPMIVALHYGTTEEPGLSPYFGLGYVGQLVLPALQDLNALIVAPDAPEESWAHPGSEAAVLGVLADVAKRHPIDAQRTLVTGFSMGGHGAWHFAATHPDRFRAAIPMAARPLPGLGETAPAAERSAPPPPLRTPLYVIHSRVDGSVPAERVERAVRALEALGGRVTLHLLDDVPHHMIPGYIEPLAGAMPWVRRVWGA